MERCEPEEGHMQIKPEPKKETSVRRSSALPQHTNKSADSSSFLRNPKLQSRKSERGLGWECRVLLNFLPQRTFEKITNTEDSKSVTFI